MLLTFIHLFMHVLSKYLLFIVIYDMMLSVHIFVIVVPFTFLKVFKYLNNSQLPFHSLELDDNITVNSYANDEASII